MKAIYTNLDGTTFEGPLFNPAMEIVTLPDGRAYQTVSVSRVELAVDENGHFIYQEDVT
jgi:hypothetical protein